MTTVSDHVISLLYLLLGEYLRIPTCNSCNTGTTTLSDMYPHDAQGHTSNVALPSGPHNSLVYSTRVDNCVTSQICSTKIPFDLRCASVMFCVVYIYIRRSCKGLLF